VANLTLMALGSSAPEILLSCIEIIGRGFRAGELGPGTIVGSAAFNLFCITGFCVIGVPAPETRRIEAINVRRTTTPATVAYPGFHLGEGGINLLVHGQVTIIFVVSVCLFVCAEFFSAVCDLISIKLGHVLYVWV